ncbi:ABC transporter ATP-binding protein [Conexibacter stalactiti]|uniref:ABC transporter ATP-binding protein n=1 Tax=Conexibacter stalactiti TaxID=1940611 RepID=A0ABU4HIB4_9ACTN|nr:ABC transporter ATP-binding protein [Conexibacter stalactiti]MDW5593043.1 ABC transporter ATP-binding protein [Conexibacter stalactiti]MEC5033684.1 ABC transporter ATP-binding protein [Conexibacter stalactiti]
MDEAPTAITPRPLLEVDGLRGGYGRKQVLYGCDLAIGDGEVVSLLGHNGAGKTTLLNTIIGLLPMRDGSVRFEGVDITRSCSPVRNKQRGISLIPSERMVFGTLSVLDNLRLGATLERSATRRAERLEEMFELFPILRERASQMAGTLSGGQQRMLVIGVTLMSSPRVLLLDEPSLGLAPAAVDSVFETLGRLAREQQLTILLVEQNIGPALKISDRVYTMRSGEIRRELSATEMLAMDRTQWWELL